MPRPKTRSDEAVLDAALDLVHRDGIERLSFAALAQQCGLAAATLVQRFGTKQQLRLRMLMHAWDRLDAQTAALAASVPRTPDGAVEMLVGLSGDFEDIEAYAESLLLLREDLRDPALRRRGVQWEHALDAALTACFADTPGAPAGIGHALASYWQGALTWWAFQPDRPLDAYLRESLAGFLSMFAVTTDGPDGDA